MVILFKHLRIAMWTVSSHFITPLRRSVSEKVIGIFSVFLIDYFIERTKSDANINTLNCSSLSD